MSSGQFLSQRQTLQQRLSPQQIQYIKLLQLPTLAFEQRIKEEMESNPALDEAESLEEPDMQDFDVNAPIETPAEKETNQEETDDDGGSVDDDHEVDWETLLQNRDEFDDSSSRRRGDEDEDWREIPRAYNESLIEDLEHQVGLLNLNEREKLIADQIIGSIDSDGYFRRSVSSIVDGIAFNAGILVTEEEVESVLRQIQRLEPAGIAARDLRECLLVQLELMPDAVAGRKLALAILRDEWAAFEKKHFDRIRKKLSVDDDQLRLAWECIQGLDPKPGAGEAGDMAADYVVPDFEVAWLASDVDDMEGEFVISLNGRNIPPLRISPVYKTMWDEARRKKQDNPANRETQQFIKGKIESARWFLDSIIQRQQTLLNVMRTIVALQEEFFKFGQGIKPMILKDVAERVKMDISTISRVVNGKYVQTKFGVYELKYFFNEGLTTDDGDEVSNREIKNLLAEIISAEDKGNPLSDLALVKELKKKGYKIARRTVSKYREQLNLPVARLRRSI